MINIAGQLHAATEHGILAAANEIFDAGTQKFLSEIAASVVQLASQAIEQDELNEIIYEVDSQAKYIVFSVTENGTAVSKTAYRWPLGDGERSESTNAQILGFSTLTGERFYVDYNGGDGAWSDAAGSVNKLETGTPVYSDQTAESQVSTITEGTEGFVVSPSNTISFRVYPYLETLYGGVYLPDANDENFRTEQAEPGMTFGDFVDSAYNTRNYQHCYKEKQYGWTGNGTNIFFTDDEEFFEDPDLRFASEEYVFAGDDVVLENGKTYFYFEMPACLLGDTEVTLADGSTKQIKDIQTGDEVLSLDLTTGDMVSRKVIYTDAAQNKQTTKWDEWEFSDGTVIKTAYRHEFYNVEAGRFAYLDEWNIGDHTYKQDGTTPALTRHTVHEEVVNHYKITLEGSNNYFANGLLTGDRYCNKENINIL